MIKITSGMINLWTEIILFLLWISVWGIMENFINIYIKADEHYKRIFIFIFMFILTFMLLYFSDDFFFEF
jgi:hypothetical protein